MIYFFTATAPSISTNYSLPMEFSTTTRNVLRGLGYLSHGQSENNLVIYTKRAVCLISCIMIVPLTIWSIVYDATTFAERIKPLLALFFGSSSFATYGVMLLQRHSILDVQSKLQLQVDKRKYYLFIYRKTIIRVIQKSWIKMNKSKRIYVTGKALITSTIYADAFSRLEHMSKRDAMILLRIFVPFMSGPAVIYSYFKYFMSKGNDTSFILAFQMT